MTPNYIGVNRYDTKSRSGARKQARSAEIRDRTVPDFAARIRATPAVSGSQPRMEARSAAIRGRAVPDYAPRGRSIRAAAPPFAASAPQLLAGDRGAFGEGGELGPDDAVGDHRVGAHGGAEAA